MTTLQTLKGFRDFLPTESRKRQWLKEQMIDVFEKWGYEPLETPTLEPLELFKGQIGEDEKLFFNFKDNGDRNVVMRYDQTVPTCRVIGQYYNQLQFPFRRYQIQPAFRAEKPQKGRYREFIQSDIDIFGIVSPIADAEIISVTLDLYKSLGFKQAVALINSRDLIADLPYSAIVSIDKLDKIGEQGAVSEMVERGITESQAKEYLNKIKSLKPNSDLQTIFNYLKTSGFSSDWYRFEPTLARAFSYSQGPIWEIRIPEYGNSSVGGGERYDALVEKISGQKIPATGIGIGFDRTLEALEVCNLLPGFASTTKVLVTVFSPELFNQSLSLSLAIRAQAITTELYPNPDTKLEKQLKYASNKGIPFVTILGPEEIKKEEIKLKNMATGEQKSITLSKLAETFSELYKSQTSAGLAKRV